jgi:hypothetical protein
MLLGIVLPQFAMATDNELENNSNGGGVYSLRFTVNDNIIKTEAVAIPEGQVEVNLPMDILPTDEEVKSVIADQDSQSESDEETVILDFIPESQNSRFLGWIDTQDESKTMYTADERLAVTEGYAPIGEFVVSRDTTFEAAFEDLIPVGEVQYDNDKDQSIVQELDIDVLGDDVAPLSQTDGNGNNLTFEVSNPAFVEVGSISNAIDWPWKSGNKQIRITADFSEQGTDKDRIITVNVPRGYKIIEYTAKESTPEIEGVSKINLSSESESKVASASLTALDGGSWADQVVLGYAGYGPNDLQPHNSDGKVTYTFNSNCDHIVLTLTLDLQYAMLSRATDTAVLDAITVDLVSGAANLSDELVATSTNMMQFQMVNQFNEDQTPTVAGIVDVDEDKGEIPQFSIRFTVINQNWSSDDFLSDSATFTFHYPEGLEFKGFWEGINEQGGTTGSYANGHLLVEDNPTARTVTFSYTNVLIGYGNTFVLYWTGSVDNDLIKWNDTLVFPAEYVANSGFESGHPVVQNYGPVVTWVTVQKPNVNIRIESGDGTRRDLNWNGDYPHDYGLGQLVVMNDGPSIAEDITYFYTFDDALAVRGIRIPGGYNDSHFRNVVAHAKTKSGATRTITYSTSFTLPWTNYAYALTPEDLGLAEDEFLTDLTITQDRLSVYASGNDEYWTYGAGTYYGRLQNGQAGTVNLTIKDKDEGVLATGYATTSKATSNKGAGSMYTVASHNPDGTNTGSFYPGDTMYINSWFYGGRTWNGDSADIVDPDIYVALPRGIDLDVNSARAVSSAGNHGDAEFPLTLLGSSEPKLINGVEWIAYHFRAPAHQDIISEAENMTGNPGESALYFTAKVSSAATAFPELDPEDIVLLDLGTSAVNATYGSEDCVLLDTHDWAGHGTGYNLVGAKYSNNIAVVQKPGLNVYLGIRAAGDTDPYYTYNGSDATVAPVTPDRPAEVWLKYENTSGDTYYPGTEIYLPIPKKNVSYNRIFNNIETTNPYGVETNEAPAWTALLTGPLTLPGFTATYSVSTSGTTNPAPESGSAEEVINAWKPYAGEWLTAAQVSDLSGDFANVTMVKFVANQTIAASGLEGSSGETTFDVAVASDAQLGQTDYWRSYQKGWRTAAGEGSWVYGSVLAAEPAMAGVKGKIFNDKDSDGILDAGENFTNLDHVSATLTSQTGTISLLNIVVNPDGSFASLSSNGLTPYYLKVGEYTLTIFDESIQRGFTTTTSGTRSNTTGVGGSAVDHWYMDVPQGNVSNTHVSATFNFTVSNTTLSTELVGVGLHDAALATYKAGTGASFATESEYRNHNQQPTASVVPVVNVAQGVEVGYDYTTVVWKANKAVTLNDGNNTVKGAGSVLTRDQVLQAKITENITFTASLEPLRYVVTFEGNGGFGYMLPGDVAYGKNYNIPANGFSLQNHHLTGWIATFTDSGSPCEPSAYGTIGTINGITQNITLTAQWAINNYSVVYKVNGGTGSVPTDSKVDYHNGDNVEVQFSPLPVKDHGVFLGWAKTAAATAPTYTVEGTKSFNITGNAILYAVYGPDSHSLTYHGNGHTSGEAPDAVTLSHGSQVIVNGQNTLARDGYSFLGWAEGAVSGVVSHPKGNVVTLTRDVELYAVWQKDEVIVEPPVVNPPIVNRVMDITPEPEEVIVEPKEPEANPPANPPTVTNEISPVTSDQAKYDAQTGNIFNDLANGNVPLGNFFSSNAWSLLSLIMSLVAVVISILLIVGAIARKRREDNEDELTGYARDGGVRDEEEERRRRGKMLKVATIILGILTPIVWLILDDLSLPMAWINKWTLFVGIVFILHIVVLVVYKVRKHEYAEDEEEGNRAIA